LKLKIPFFQRKEHGSRKKEPGGRGSFQALFEKFRELLTFNNRLLETVAEMGEKLSGDYVFDTRYLEESVSQVEDLARRIIYDLNAIADNRYLALNDVFERIRLELRAELAPERLPIRQDLVVPLSEANAGRVELVGGKMGMLGEIRSRLGKRVPDGFVMTTNAYRRFVGSPPLAEMLSRAYEDLDAGAEPAEVSERVCRALEGTDLPPELEKAMQQAARKLEQQGHRMFSVRSSAVGEDGELSYAGQYRSYLDVTTSRLAERYRQVVASLVSPEAITYRREHGVRHQESAMAVGVLAMVEPRVSGVMYTRDPEAPEQDAVLISAAWGLARTVVEGRSGTDHFRVRRSPSAGAVIQSKIGRKEKQLLPDEKEGEREEAVPADRQTVPCLAPQELIQLAEIACELDTYFRTPQDIEWVIDAAGEPILLQTRPLRVREVQGVDPETIADAVRARPRLMEDAGMVACRGIGAGPVVRILSDADFDRFQRGAVLVARSTSPKLSRLIPLASAIVTDIGTPTGHMATVAREYRVPTLVDTGTATERLQEGMEVTVDAGERVIYPGIVQELLQYQALMEPPFADALEFRILRRLLKKISPLYLTDPQAKEFAAENCRTVHDITRFCHEMAVKEFIDFHLRGRRWKRNAVHRLSLPVPLGLVVIDIGDGIATGSAGKVLKPEEIACQPLHALLVGLCREGVWRTEPVDIDFRSFMSSFTRTSHAAAQDPRGAQNLAVVSRDYMNLNLRLGYHFNMIDALMTENRSDNYIYFRFLGGVTDLSRRSRRARFLGEVLGHHDFLVEVKGDLVVSRIRKISRAMMQDRLEMLGRLVGFARQLDVLMKSDEAVEKFVRAFLDAVPAAEPVS
jgi:pyruvate, water dikinase